MADATPPESTPFDVRAILRNALLAMAGLALLAGVLGLAFKEPIERLSCSFVETFGAWGVAAGFFVPDATALPVWHDLFLFLGQRGGLSDVEVIVAASVGSVLGGCTAYALAATARRVPWVAARLGGGAKREEARLLVERYGVYVFLAEALTPIPYALVAWGCGLFGMRVPLFLALSIVIRTFRVVVYFYGIQGGAFLAGFEDTCGP